MPATLARQTGISVVTACVLLGWVGCARDDSAPPPATGDSSASQIEAELGTLRSELDSHASVRSTPDQAAGSEGQPSGTSVAAAGEGWGDLSVRFVYDGPAPAPAPIKVTSDQDYCCRTPLVMENLVVNAGNKGIANVVVCLYTRRGETPPTPHPSYQQTADAIVTLDNASCRFEPHICLLRTSQTLRVNNRDEVSHNTNSDLQTNPRFNEIIPVGGHVDKKLVEPEAAPVPISCNMHPWMKGYLLVKDTPYMAVSDADGRIHIENLPVGDWTFQAWHEQASYVSNVALGGERVSWKQGRWSQPIRHGENDLGDVVIGASQFQK